MASLLVAGLLSVGCGSSGNGGASRTATTTVTRASSPPPLPTHPSTSAAAPTAAQIDARVDAQVKKIIRARPAGSVSVAALNTASGRKYSAGAMSGMWTASAYKLYVLEALLLRQGSLSDYQVNQATSALENSDNVAGYSLFLAAGGNSALGSAAQRFGMTHTVPGNSDPTFTRTSAIDCLQLLRNLVRPDGPFSADTRSFVLGLMRNVEPDQRWGVGAAADKASIFYNKNGWLSVDNSNGPDEADDGRWITTSLGILTIKGQQVLMAVLTQHNRSFGDGVALVQQLARTIAPAVSKR